MPEVPNIPDNSSTPPWGDDFDAEKAWTLIQGLRADKTKLSNDLATERQERAVEKAQADLKPADDSADKIAAAEKRATDAERTLFVERAVHKHGIPENLVDFLTGDTEEEITAKAERLAGIKAPAEPEAPKEEPKEEPKADEQGRPKPALVPGHTGDITTPINHDEIVKEIRKNR